MAGPIIKLGLLGDRVTTRLSNQLKRETLRQLPSVIINFLSRFGIEFPDVPGKKVIESIDLTLPDIKIFSYVAYVDQTPVGFDICYYSVLFGIEDLSLDVADDWGDIICKVRILRFPDGDYLSVRFMGTYTHAKIYLDGILRYESERRPDGRYYTDWSYMEKITE